MKILLMAILTSALSVSSAQAQNTGAPGEGVKPLNITANFQVRIPVDSAASTADVTKALSEANQSLGDLATRQCDALAAAFKSDCRVTQLNMSANVNDRRFNQQFNNDSGGQQRFVNANLNATFELTAQAEAPKSPPAVK